MLLPPGQGGVQVQAARAGFGEGQQGGRLGISAGVLQRSPDDPEVRYFRDPFVVRDGDTWRMVVGAGLAGLVAVLVIANITDQDDDNVEPVSPS